MGAYSTLATVLDGDGATLLVEEDLRHFPLTDGVLLGRLFLRGQTEPCAEFDAIKQASCVSSGGRNLPATCWGSYLAIMPDPARPAWHILRAPFGMLPCLWAQQDGLTWVASDLPLLEEAGLRRPAIDWAGLRLHLLQPDLRRSRTCLNGVHELQGGHRLTIRGGRTSLEEIWCPWTFARLPEVPPWDAATRLRGAVDLSVKAMSSRYDRGVLMLSGGIDSSIAAASLRQAGRHFDCLTFRPAGAGGDESGYAAAVAERLHVPWHEIVPDPARVDLQRSTSRHLPRPSERLFYQEFDRCAVALASSMDATAIYHGGGGDNLFYGYLSVAPVADCLLRSNGRFRASAGALADLAGASRWRVMAMAARRALRKRRPIQSGNLRFDFLTGGPSETPYQRHPWEDPPADILPGKASHVALLAPTLSLVETVDPLRLIPSVPLLMTQPLVETCLTMPTDLWFAPGRNRAIARTAFAERLPQDVINRRSKGSPDAFIATIFEQRKAEIRALLLDGHLAGSGLIDRARLRAAVDDAALAKGYDFTLVLDLVDAEAWVRSRL
ncbi:asparagine synthase C-terminal domain-containing protein [Sphingomonas crusticola]|uniref:asparagine synthase-related protein n=1 Tax=Sphingomonas crusticola TaxID=1697973 RepID=UPI0013C2EC05|nr:asparagine synthase C-terminal domain-containing protein [Sphingomonas crusticola]